MALNALFVSTEELCTLVITEAFPEDSGLFKCVILNSFGTVSCCAMLEVYNGEMFIFIHCAYYPHTSTPKTLSYALDPCRP